MEFLTHLLDNSTMPWLTAFLLGLMTAISPCALATNITAIGFISKDIENRNRVFYNGLLFTFGRAITYTLIPLMIYLGADQLKFSGFFQQNGDKFLGPLMVVIGLFMLDLFRLNFPGMSRITAKMQGKKSWNSGNVVLLGSLFSLAFCPFSGIMFFGMLVPLTISSASGLFLPLIFALATGLPVIIFAGLLAYSISGIGTFYNKVRVFELWFRRLIALLFIAVGIYYIYTVFL